VTATDTTHPRVVLEDAMLAQRDEVTEVLRCLHESVREASICDRLDCAHVWEDTVREGRFCRKLCCCFAVQRREGIGHRGEERNFHACAAHKAIAAHAVPG
jgi:hypothetical protein